MRLMDSEGKNLRQMTHTPETETMPAIPLNIDYFISRIYGGAKGMAQCIGHKSGSLAGQIHHHYAAYFADAFDVIGLVLRLTKRGVLEVYLLLYKNTYNENSV
jgi:hypothetical protein